MGEQIIKHRAFDLCPTMAAWPIHECVKECPDCEDFLLWCCGCNNKYYDLPESQKPTRPCHHFRIVFTDGACTHNGNPRARAGAGVAYGNNDVSQLSIPITDDEDHFPLRSNQRAELYAARLGLAFLAEAAHINTQEASGKPKNKLADWIIATDSEYVVKGMTEWLPKWKKNNWCTARGTKPLNLDLFLALDSEMKKHEANNTRIGLWWVPREFNKVADGLAKKAAIDGDLASAFP
ncbi:hypothetical protein HBI68_181080 [Parastagonospora nodorum]|nr:hypothetical protein HBI33_185830 [Parastagonospora nodorum]KAH6150309.1 hypothetical protein HBI68_181080 [Parastagonospora nodorum]